MLDETEHTGLLIHTVQPRDIDDEENEKRDPTKCAKRLLGHQALGHAANGQSVDLTKMLKFSSRRQYGSPICFDKAQ